jgi:hypothetical protein
MFLKPLAVALVVAAVLTAGAASSALSATDARGTTFTPKFDPANFSGRAIDNRYFPLKPGTVYVYRGIEEGKRSRDVVTVTHRTKTILGVKARVVRDRLFLNGKLAEDTADWYAQDKHGNVWYLGENTAELKAGKVVSTEGSWQTGVKGAKPGIIMQAHPHVGDTYRQEFLKGHAEDRARVLSRSARVSVPYGSFTKVQVVKEWSPLEPKVIDRKYYAPGIGLVKEATAKGPVETGKLVKIRVACR